MTKRFVIQVWVYNATKFWNMMCMMDENRVFIPSWLGINTQHQFSIENYYLFSTWPPLDYLPDHLLDHPQLNLIIPPHCTIYYTTDYTTCNSSYFVTNFVIICYKKQDETYTKHSIYQNNQLNIFRWFMTGFCPNFGKYLGQNITV